jgi:deoxyribodipyrimidine photolyase
MAERRKKALVWVTHSFRMDSRLMEAAEQYDCAFVYVSSWWLAGPEERRILSRSSLRNNSLFRWSLARFSSELAKHGHKLTVLRGPNAVKDMVEEAKTAGITQILFDEPIFAVWRSISLDSLGIPVIRVDSDLIDPKCDKRTAKSRLASHTSAPISAPNPAPNLSSPVKLHLESKPYGKEGTEGFDAEFDSDLARARAIAPTYSLSRDSESGQTRLSRWFQHGVLDPSAFFSSLQSKTNTDPALLRQMCFRELHIMKARRLGLTLEDGPGAWCGAILDRKSFSEFRASKRNVEPVSFGDLISANTGDRLVDRIMEHAVRTGHMPNRARMFLAGWCYSHTRTAAESYELCSSVFDLTLDDGQCPTNRIQNAEALALKYGRVMQFNRARTESLLWPTEELFGA